MNKKLTFAIAILFFSQKCFSQYFDQGIWVNSTNCCTVQSVGMDFFSVDKYGNRYSMSSVATQGYPPWGSFSCAKSAGASWGVSFINKYNTWFTDAQPDYLGNTICSGTTFPVFYFNAAHTISYTNGNFYVKYDSTGNAQWAVQRFGNSYATDKSGGFISAAGGTLYKYNTDGAITWQKPIQASYAASSYDHDYFYLLTPGVSKCDTAGNITWTSGSYSGTKLIADSMENIYIRSGSSIHKLDSAGNFIFTRSYSGMVDYTVDKAGNIYILLDLDIKKYDVTGSNLLWSYHSTAEVDNKKIGVDRNYRVYYIAYYADYLYNGNPNEIFFPPSFHHAPSGTHTYLSYMGARISQDAASALNTIVTGNAPLNSLQNVCSGITFNCDFTINSFPVNPSSNPLFKVQLSDSSGSFTNATIIGQGNYSPISCTIPASVIPGNNYRTRVVVSDLSVTGTPNANGPFKIRTSPPSSFTVTNYTKYQDGTYYGCTVGAPIQLNAATIANGKYQWNKYYYFPNTYYSPISGATNTLYNTPPVAGITYYALFTTDTTTGCTGISGLDTVRYTNLVATYISNLPSAVCLNQAPITLDGEPSGSYFPESGLGYLIFYPDSAGVGVHNITLAYDTWGCGIVDTVQSITVKGLPAAAITASGPTTFCSGGSVVLNAPVYNNRTYQWKKGGTDIAGATSSNYTASIGGVYKATVTNTVTGCTKTTGSGTTVTVNPLPNATITPQGPTTFCNGSSVILKANAGSGLTYKWKKDGAFISGAIGITYTAFVAGTYKVQVANTNSCKKISPGVLISVPCREDEELNQTNDGISLFPNPTSGKFTIQSRTENILQISITNVSGQTIFKKDVEEHFNSQMEIDLSTEAKGVYLIQIVTGKKVINQKIIID